MSNKQKNVVIAFGDRKPNLSKELERVFTKESYQTVFTSEKLKENITKEVKTINTQHGDIDVFIYIPHPLYKTSILDNDIDDKVYSSIYENLEVGTWWIQAVGNSMIKRQTKGKILILTHVNSLVPTHEYSYSSLGQAALTNLAKVAALEFNEYEISSNIIAVGWSESSDEKNIVEQLRDIHKEDVTPLLSYTHEKDVATICLNLSNPEIVGVNGAVITVDSGYSVTRPIRQFN